MVAQSSRAGRNVGILPKVFQKHKFPLELPGYRRVSPAFLSAGTDCSWPGLVACGGANGGGKPTKARKIRIGIRQ